MAKKMTDVEVDAFKEALATITARGNEAELMAHIDTFFPRLPEDMQQEILTSLYVSALRAEVQDSSKE